MAGKIAPSILAADFRNLEAEARACEEAGADCLHFDVMDGRFVPNISFGAMVIEALRPLSRARFETHLMILEPERYLADFAKAGSDLVTVHYEAATHAQRTLAQIRELGARAGLALNPATPLDAVDYLLDDIDLLLIMTVNPGFGGQRLIQASCRKVQDARRLIAESGRPIEIEVDGGVGPENVRALAQSGADVFVAGTTVFKHPDGPQAGIRAIRSQIETG